ncbi:MAG: biopolymer transporter ExbD, partial [Longimicrobiales bacterium]|nr:biopolymer transporter ExbD [Longimicrobiales bacterium]
MSIKSGGLDRKSKASSEIPSSSLADIAFLLLIFFMVTTVFQNDKERPITWAEAAATEKIDEKVKNILNIWMERDGSIWINDEPVPMEDVSEKV